MLIVRDGWGYAPSEEHNMIAQAHTPFTDALEKEHPNFLIEASGKYVGLPEGYFGNSEVGHMTLGAGHVLKQSLLRIDDAIKDGSFFENESFLQAIAQAREYHSKLHLVGILQKEGVHGSFDHLLALVKLAKQEGLSREQVYIHVIVDGRDAPKQNALRYLDELETKLIEIGVGEVVSLGGRYFAMDRNENWERTEQYYKEMLGRGTGETFVKPTELLKERYLDSEFSDEFLAPLCHESFAGVQEHDAIIFYNFRKDRARQLSHAFVDENFIPFETYHKNIYFVGMTEYFEGLPHVAFPDLSVENPLGKVLAERGRTQLRISETEKYAHVTFFFDGGVDREFEGCSKILIPSPDVATFDLKPEMASREITEALISEIETNEQDFILCNFPNADMVGHTGNHEAIKKGVEAVDRALEKIIPRAIEHGYSIILTADHGNAEYKAGACETSHTANKVPCTCINFKKDFTEPHELSDIKSLVLSEMNISEE